MRLGKLFSGEWSTSVTHRCVVSDAAFAGFKQPAASPALRPSGSGPLEAAVGCHRCYTKARGGGLLARAPPWAVVSVLRASPAWQFAYWSTQTWSRGVGGGREREGQRSHSLQTLSQR